jgi:thiamine pyrophosphokinase
MKKFVIVSGGRTSEQFVADVIAAQQPERIIAADSGMEVLKKCGIMPDTIIGDFDSVKKDTLEFFKRQPGICWHTLNPVKDDTDTEYAIRLAIREGAEHITILGGTGSRLDHVLGNIQLLGIGLQEKVSMELIDEHNRIRMIDHGISLRREEQFGKYVSLIPYTAEVAHVSLKGFAYLLQDAYLKGFCSIGVSNEITEETAEITFTDGILLVIEARD